MNQSLKEKVAAEVEAPKKRAQTAKPSKKEESNQIDSTPSRDEQIKELSYEDQKTLAFLKKPEVIQPVPGVFNIKQADDISMNDESSTSN